MTKRIVFNGQKSLKMLDAFSLCSIQPHVTARPHLFKAAELFDPFYRSISSIRSRTRAVSSLPDHAVNAVLGGRK